MKEITRRDFVKNSAAAGVVMAAAGGTLASSVSAATAPAKSTEGTFTVLNPRPDKEPIDVPGLAPRLASLDGKSIYVLNDQNSLDDMLEYTRALKAAVPTANVFFVYDVPTSPGEMIIVKRPADEPGIKILTLAEVEKDPKKANAAVVGNGY
jgi:hypothetical protein